MTHNFVLFIDRNSGVLFVMIMLFVLPLVCYMFGRWAGSREEKGDGDSQT